MKSSRPVALLALAALLVIAAGSTAFAKTINVPGGKPTIQAAIDAAVNGDVVVVAKGRYQENIDFKGKAITVQSTKPSDQTVVAATIIDGQKKGSVVTFKSGEAVTSVLEGFTLTNGSGTAVPDEGGYPGRYFEGGGVYCLGSSPTLSRNTITGNSARASQSGAGGDGGGVYCKASSPHLANNTISGNTAEGSGGGVDCWSDSSPALINNTISGNKATSGDGGGGVFCDSSDPVIRNSIIAFNTEGGGLKRGILSSPVVAYCDFWMNTGGNYVNWPDQTGKKGNISHDPLFANAAKGDFHEKSKGGRWNPKTKAWVMDTVHSPCIDAGDPASAFDQEPTPNGGRINMGAYGDTPYASKSAPMGASGGLVLTATAVSTGSGLAQIRVNLTSAASVQVTVLNLAGREVAALPAQDLPAGVSTLLWDGKSPSGTMAPAGRYLVRVTARGADGNQAQALAGLSLGR